MEEADNLCDRIGIIDYGKIQKIDSPQVMKNALGNEVISFSILDGANKNDLVVKLRENDLVKDIKVEDEQITVFASKGN